MFIFFYHKFCIQPWPPRTVLGFFPKSFIKHKIPFKMFSKLLTVIYFRRILRYLGLIRISVTTAMKELLYHTLKLWFPPPIEPKQNTLKLQVTNIGIIKSASQFLIFNVHSLLLSFTLHRLLCGNRCLLVSSSLAAVFHPTPGGWSSFFVFF